MEQASKPQAQAAPPTTATGTTPGAGARGAARGAVVGEIINDDAGAGAAVGAAASTVRRWRRVGHAPAVVHGIPAPLMPACAAQTGQVSSSRARAFRGSP